jgi:hypothetical protein
MDDVIITCQSITYLEGYPVLRKVFRHLARTPKSYAVWIDTRRPGDVYSVSSYSSGELVASKTYPLLADGADAVILDVLPGYEGGLEIAMIDAVSGAERALRDVHFGGLTWQSPGS